MTELLPVQTEQSTPAQRIPLALQQDFLRLMDNGSESGPFGPRYTIVAGWRVFGPLDEDAVRAALRDVVTRHEALRTQIVLDDGDPYQRVLPAGPVELMTTDLSTRTGERDRLVEDFLNEVESTVSITAQTPRMKVALGRFDPGDAVIVFVAHHTVADGASLQVVMRDFAAYYAARRDRWAAQLPEVRQYRDYVAWQRSIADGPEVHKARQFWREYLRGAHMLPVATDRQRSEGGYVTGWYRFMVEEQLRLATLATAKRLRCSPFMLLLGGLLMVLRERTGESDITIPTLMSGRHPIWTQDLTGVFYNFMPLRTDLTGCATLAEVVSRVRKSCLAAYPNELPFMQVAQEAPELMATVATPDAAAVAFQVIQHPEPPRGEQVGDLRYVAVRRRVVSTPIGSQIPDGILAELDLHPEGGMFGKAAYVQSLYDRSTVAGLMDDFVKALRDNLGGAA